MKKLLLFLLLPLTVFAVEIDEFEFRQFLIREYKRNCDLALDFECDIERYYRFIGRAEAFLAVDENLNFFYE